MTDLEKVEREFEQALIDLCGATDGRGLKIMLGPRSLSFVTCGSASSEVYSPKAFQKAVCDFMQNVTPESVFLTGIGMPADWEDGKATEAFARNLKLLAAAWEQSVRYENEVKTHGA